MKLFKHHRAIQAIQFTTDLIQSWRTAVGTTRHLSEDDKWFEVQLRPQKASEGFQVTLPSLPPDDVQLRFTGMTGRQNLQQAFYFYKYACEVSGLDQLKCPRILDFGGGWGRISRFFLRNTKPEFIWITDCLSDSIYWLSETRNPCNIIKNAAFPPIAGLSERFNLIYSYSVFSHLSPQATEAWLKYLMELLLPGGFLVITTRGSAFITYLKNEQRKKNVSFIAEIMPPAEELSARYENNEFQFYPLGGGGELSLDFYGETIIPRSYFDENYGSVLIDFTESVPYVDQSVIVLQKKQD